MLYWICWVLCKIPLLVFGRVRVVGRQHVPKRGAVILAPNHISNMDPPIVGTSIYRPAWFMAKDELFKNPAAGWLISSIRAYPVKRGGADRAALKRTLEFLAAGEAVTIFPEGTRSETGELGEGEVGVGMIAYRSGAPVVPVAISGTDRMLPRGARFFHFAPVRIEFGEPVQFVAEPGKRPGREEYAAATRTILERIRTLREQARR